MKPKLLSTPNKSGDNNFDYKYANSVFGAD